MTNLIKKIAAMAATVMMMGTMTIGASAKTLSPTLISYNCGVGYTAKISARNLNYNVLKCQGEKRDPKTHKLKKVTYNNKTVPDYPVKYTIKGDKSSNIISLSKYNNKNPKLFLQAEIEEYNKKTKRTIRSENHLVTQNAGCGTSLHRKSDNKYYSYFLCATVQKSGDYDPMLSRQLMLNVEQE